MAILTVNDIISAALDHADQARKSVEKTAEAKPVDTQYVSTLADQMHKVAVYLKGNDVTKVTNAEVISFAKRIAE